MERSFISLRHFIKRACLPLFKTLLAAAFTLTSAQSILMAQPFGQKPNIIYILADDAGYGDFGVYGQQEIKTPNIDQMGREGVIFTQHYAGSTVCAPSRCSLLTGQHTGHCSIRGNVGALDSL